MSEQAVAKALREREEALLTVHALENELRQKRRGISSLEESGQQVSYQSLSQDMAVVHAPILQKLVVEKMASIH